MKDLEDCIKDFLGICTKQDIIYNGIITRLGFCAHPEPPTHASCLARNGGPVTLIK